MPEASVYSKRTHYPAFICTLGFVFSLFLFSLLSAPAQGALVRSLEGSGNFHAQFDVLNRWQDDGTLDVLIMVEVPNASLTYKEETGGLVSRLRLEVELKPIAGETIVKKRPFHTAPLRADDSQSRVLNQVFGVILKDVPHHEGRISIQLYDVNKYREGIWNQYKRKLRRTEASTMWVAEENPRASRGLALGDPLYLFLAPLNQWDPSQQSFAKSGGGLLHDYMHPSRRYGITQDKLQVFLPIWPPAGGLMPGEDHPGLAVQVTSLDMDFALNDTINFDELGQMALEAGRPAGLFYELDVNLLPQGSYRLTVAPLDGQGRGLSSGFDVIWRLDSLGRHYTRLMAEGNLIFEGDDLAAFLESSPAEREAMMDKFWDELNPDPENPFNEAYLEFQARMAYVESFLGGFDEFGPRDDRGLVMVLLGPPDELQREAMPMNFRDQDDAQIKVFKRFAPDREGVTAKGSSPEGGQSINPYDREGGIPMPYSERASAQIQFRSRSAVHNFSFELWKYDRNGKPLFDNRFSRSSMGARFLFLDRSGSGDYYLESSNTIQGEE